MPPVVSEARGLAAVAADLAAGNGPVAIDAARAPGTATYGHTSTTTDITTAEATRRCSATAQVTAGCAGGVARV